MVAGSDHGSAAKGSTIDLEVTGSGPVSCCFSFPPSFFTMCSSLACLSVTPSINADLLHLLCSPLESLSAQLLTQVQLCHLLKYDLALQSLLWQLSTVHQLLQRGRLVAGVLHSDPALLLNLQTDRQTDKPFPHLHM